jgi:hypothetical protein
MYCAVDQLALYGVRMYMLLLQRRAVARSDSEHKYGL